MTDLPDHFCPGCGAAQKPFPRYPWHFCPACLGLAQDGSGRRLAFGNAGPGGGFAWRYRDEDPPDWRSDAAHVLCEISGRPVLVHEARFGGVVAEPLPDRPMGDTPYKLVDLRRGAR